MNEWRKPYRLNVFANGFRPGRRRRTYSEIFPCSYGFMGWTPVQVFDRGARLPNAGSFLYPGIVAVRKAAMEYLSNPNVHQVSVRTDQDKQVYRYFKQADGQITGYYGTGD